LLAVVTGIDSEDGKSCSKTAAWCAYDTAGSGRPEPDTPISAHGEGSPTSRPQDVGNATTIRRRILLSFEQAERETDPGAARRRCSPL